MGEKRQWTTLEGTEIALGTVSLPWVLEGPDLEPGERVVVEETSSGGVASESRPSRAKDSKSCADAPPGEEWTIYVCPECGYVEGDTAPEVSEGWCGHDLDSFERVVVAPVEDLERAKEMQAAIDRATPR